MWRSILYFLIDVALMRRHVRCKKCGETSIYQFYAMTSPGMMAIDELKICSCLSERRKNGGYFFRPEPGEVPEKPYIIYSGSPALLIALFVVVLALYASHC